MISGAVRDVGGFFPLFSPGPVFSGAIAPGGVCRSSPSFAWLVDWSWDGTHLFLDLE